MILFCLLLGIFALGAPGVPGGTVMASLGLITGVLGFNETGTALMLTIFAFRTALVQHVTLQAMVLLPLSSPDTPGDTILKNRISA